MHIFMQVHLHKIQDQRGSFFAVDLGQGLAAHAYNPIMGSITVSQPTKCQKRKRIIYIYIYIIFYNFFLNIILYFICKIAVYILYNFYIKYINFYICISVFICQFLNMYISFYIKYINISDI